MPDQHAECMTLPPSRGASPAGIPHSTRTRRRAARAAAAVTALTFLALAACAPAGSELPTPTERPADVHEPTSTVFATVDIPYHSTVRTDSDGDLWPAAWADDGALYSANGDGRGFSDLPWADIVVNRIDGTPEEGLTGERLQHSGAVAPIWGDPAEYNRKPTGMVAVDGDGDGRDELYLAVQDLRMPPSEHAFNDAPTATIVRSDDYGATWTWPEQPMFTDHVFTTVMFLDLGQSNSRAGAVEPGGEDYVYAYGLDHNWRDSFSDVVPDPVDLYLARVPKDAIQDRGAWEFFAGTAGTAGTDGDAARWSSDVADRVAVLTDDRRVYPELAVDGPTSMSVISQGGVVYDEPIGRYLYTSWTEFTWELYEAPTAWGPWTLFASRDFGPYPWLGEGNPEGRVNGGYAVTLPSKFISDDGLHLWAQANWFVGAPTPEENTYHYALRPLTLTLRSDGATPFEADGGTNVALASSGSGVVAVDTHSRLGAIAALNDDDATTGVDSWNGTPKTRDVWGYTWPQPVTVDRVELVPGDVTDAGGWFDGDLAIEVRRGGAWEVLTSVRVDPEYPFDASAADAEAYAFTFDAVTVDGVRLVGRPGGSGAFTAVAELRVLAAG